MLRAGAAQTDISPAMGVHLGGDLCRHRPADKILDPLYAKALVLEDEGGTRICLVGLDLCVVDNVWADRMRTGIEARFELPRDAVMLYTIQNHSAPSVGPLLFRENSPYVPPELWWLLRGDPDYPPFLEPRIMETVERALADLQPVRVRHTNGVDGRIGFNRRFVKRDGTVQTIPRHEDLPDVLHVEGPTDPDVAVVAFYDEADRMRAALLHHTCHPVSFFNTNHVTASWPGHWCRRFREHVGGDVVPLMLNGCCGNISPQNPLDREHRSDDGAISERLMQTTLDAFDRFRDLAPTPAIDFRSRTIPIPRPPADPSELADARALLAASPEPGWLNRERRHVDIAWAFAALLCDLAEDFRERPQYPYEVQVFRVGDLSIVGLKGEPFVEGQLAIKAFSPAARTIVVHQCNGYLGYLPTREGAEKFNYNFYDEQGHPVRRGATRLVLVPEAMDRVLDTTREVFKEMWPC